MRRPVVLALTVSLAAGSLAACGGGPDRDDIEELRAAIARTERLSHRFEYEEEELISGTTTRVLGVVEDDFRYKVRVEVDGAPALDEVVYDDAVADRFYDLNTLRGMLRKSRVEPATSTDEDLASPSEVGAALGRSQWVIDPVGAPALFDTVANEERQIGDDPVVDAQTVFQYVDRVSRLQPVQKFNEDSLDYKPKDDPFPKPSRDSDITRYDFVRFPVPRPSEGAASGRQAVPNSPSFRKMSVYVRGGRVIRVLELIDVVDRLDDIERNYEIKLEGSTTARVKTAIDAINAVRRGQGERQNIRVRRLDFKLVDLGEEQEVALPETSVKGSLVLLENRGKVKPGSTSEPAGDGDADATSTADATATDPASSTPSS